MAGGQGFLYSTKTLGNLLKQLREKIDVPVELQAYFTRGLSNRNAVVHQFLHRNVELLHSPQGRIEVTSALIKAKQEVKLADVVANKLLDRYLEKYGLSVELLKENADRLWRHMNPLPPPMVQ